jgi:uncharacterized protein
MTTGRPDNPRGRDRNRAGRPRNARPRDATGRPLSYESPGEARIPEDLALTPPEALGFAQQLLDDGRPFQAHEVLEASWKSAPPAERDLWQGLAQIAVGLTHAQRGNARGAATLLRRGAGRVAGYLPTDETGRAGWHNIDVPGVLNAANALADRIDRDGLDALTPPDLRLHLTVQ